MALVIIAATEPVAGSGPIRRRRGRVGVGGDEPGAGRHQPDGLGDRRKRQGAGLAEDDVVRLGVGQGVADLVQRRGQPRFADDVGRASRQLGRQEVRGGQGRRPDRLPRAPASPREPGRAERSRGVKTELLVSTRNRRPRSTRRTRKIRGPGQGVALVHEDAIHVDQPALGRRARSVHQLIQLAAGVARAPARSEDAPPAPAARIESPLCWLCAWVETAARLGGQPERTTTEFRPRLTRSRRPSGDGSARTSARRDHLGRSQGAGRALDGDQNLQARAAGIQADAYVCLENNRNPTDAEGHIKAVLQGGAKP